jgi:hypothetical protein
MPPTPGSKTMNRWFIGIVALLVGGIVPLGLLLTALALPSIFALYNAVRVGQMLSLALVVLAGYLFLRTPGWVKAQQNRKP